MLRPCLFLLCASVLLASALPPRVIFVATLDDFGYASASFNQASPTWETVTPRMDELARSGVILRRAYCHSFCSPTRSAFLSGRLPVHVQVNNVQPDMPNAGVPSSMTTLPQKLSAAGWSCHVVGKWDTGAVTYAHTPEGRGYNSSLVYFSHAIDYFTHRDYDGSPAANEMCDDKLVDLWDSGAPARDLNGTGFIDDLLLQRVLQVISSHDFDAAPLFIHYTPHATHDPLQVPSSVFDRFNASTNDESWCNASIAVSSTGTVYPGYPADRLIPCRRVFEALVSVLDNAIGQIVDALVQRGVWNDTLFVTFSDNGGQPDLTYGGGRNDPLRGGKGSEFEGGYRVASFVAGGALPEAVRGTIQHGMIHVADWLGTLCHLAGAGTWSECTSDPGAAAAGLPPIDSLDMWPLISGANATSPRTEFAASLKTLITTDWKLIYSGNKGSKISEASWQGDLWPNASSPSQNVEAVQLDCSETNNMGGACLFDMRADPTEHFNVAMQEPELVKTLKARLSNHWAPSFYSNNETAVCRRNASIPIAHVCACEAGSNQYSGFFGPYGISV